MNSEEKPDFEGRLLTELRRVAAERPEPAAEKRRARSPWRPKTVAFGGGGVATAVAVIAVVAGGGGGASNAYAVEKEPDGQVTVKIESLKDAEGLETKLVEAGVPAVVDYAPAITLECASPTVKDLPDGEEPEVLSVRRAPVPAGSVPPPKAVRPAEPAPPLPDGAEARRLDSVSVTTTARTIPVGEGATFTIDPRDIKEGDKLYVTKPTRADAPGVAAAIAPPGEAPGC